MILEDKNKPMKKNLIFLVTFFLLLTACTNKEVIKIEGNDKGTNYNISYIDIDNKNYKRDIE